MRIFKLINKTLVLVTVGVVLALAITSLGIVQKVKDNKAVAAEASQRTSELAAKEKQLSDTIARLQASQKAEQGAETVVSASCAEFRRLDAIKSITASVSVPAYCINR